MPSFGGIVVPTGGPPGSNRRTLSEIVDELARPVDAADGTIRALAGDAFRAAVRRFNFKGLWPWEIQDEDVAIIANERFSTVTSAIKKPLAMHLLDEAGGTRDERIGYTAYDVFCEKYTFDISGNPHTYTVPNLFETGQVRWFPVPSSDDNARLTFYRMTPAPRNETEPVEIPEYVTEAYVTWARYEFLKRLPPAQRSLDLRGARDDAYIAFREISAHVASPGDRSRQVAVGGLV